MTADESRDARAHFAHQVETCEQGIMEIQGLINENPVNNPGANHDTIGFWRQTQASLVRDARLAQAAVEGLDALERERKATNESPMPQRFTCPCGRKYEVGTIPDVFGDRVVRSLYACLVEGPVLPLLNVQVTGTKTSR